MKSNEIENIIKNSLGDSSAEVLVRSDDGCHFDAVVVTDQFEGKSLLQRQRLVFKDISEHVQTGDIHALSLKTYTKEERKLKGE